MRWFFGVWRRDGTQYLDHLIQTLKNTKKYDESFDSDSILIALLHDSIEDTEETFDTLQKKYWDIIALWVDTLSKKPFWEYIPQWNNDNNLWTQEAKDFSNIKTSIEDFIWKKIDHDFKLSDHSLLPNDLRAWWEKYKEKYKETRKEQYFKKFESLESLKNHIKNQATLKEIEISEGELELLTHKVATIKLADRLHNITTLPSEKIEAKSHETNTYLKKIWKELWGEVWERIAKEMFRLASASKHHSIMSII